MGDKINLFELDINIEALTENTAKVYREINSLTDSQKNLKKTTSDLKKEIESYNKLMSEAKKANDTDTYDELKKSQDELKKQYADTTSELTKNQSELKAARKEYNLGVKMIDAYSEKQRQSLAIVSQTDGSIDQLSAALSNNKAVYKSLSKEERENTEIGGKLLELIQEQDEEYKKLHTEIGNTSVNVGNYEEAIKSAVDGMDLFSGGMGSILSKFIALSQQEGGVKGFFSTFTGGIKSATKAGLKFILTPIGAVIAAIVLGITLLTKAITRNQGASDKFQTIWSGISNVIEEIIGRLFRVIGAIGKLIKGDFKGGIQELKSSFTGLGEAMENAYNEGMKLATLQQELEKANITATTSQARLNAEIEKYSTLQDDNTRSFKEREAAAAKVRELEAQRSKENLDLAQKEVDIANLKAEQAKRQGKLTRDLLLEQAEAQAKLIEMEGNYTKTIAENEKVRRELKQDRLERDLDILLDGYDNQKTINERIISDDKQTFEKRRELLDETKKLGDESFAKQIETIQQFTGKAIDANALLSESNAEMLNEKIRELGLSEIIEGRLLEVIRDRRTATQDLVEAQRDLTEQQVQWSIDMAEKELDLYIAKNKSKIDSETRLTDEILAEEENRLHSIYEKELAFLEQEKEAKLITDQDYQLRKIDLQNQFIEQEKELNRQYREQKLEQEQADFEYDIELKAIRGQLESEIELQRLDQQYAVERQKAIEHGTWTVKQEQVYAEKRKKIEQAVQNEKTQLYSDAMGNIATIVGEQTAVGKAAAVAQATIDTYMAANAAYSSLAGIPVIGPALGIAAAAAAIASGIRNVKKIVSTKTDVPKAESGMVMDIGGKRHSAGGTKFYGSDGTVFEAERGEKMFILNRMASKAYSPYLSRLNQMYGGVPLSQSSSYLAAGGAVARVGASATNVNVQGNNIAIDYDLLAQKIGQYVVEGNKSLPNPVTDVKDIISEVNKYNKVVDGASF